MKFLNKQIVWTEHADRHPLLDALTVAVSALGLAAASAYFILLYYFPGTVLPVL